MDAFAMQLIEALDLAGRVQAKKTVQRFASVPCLPRAIVIEASCCLQPTAFPSNPGGAAADAERSRTVDPPALGQAIGNTGERTVQYRSEPCLLRPATSASGRAPMKCSSAPDLATGTAGDVRRENVAKTVVEAPTGDVVVRQPPADGLAREMAERTLSRPTTERTLWKRTKRFAASCVRYVGRRVCFCSRFS